MEGEQRKMIEKKAGIRITKTVTALFESLCTLLKHFDFDKITIEALCAEALVSRATFYAHFNDKYDLLSKWLITLISENILKDDPYSKIENIANQFISKNKRVIKNIVDDANRDTLRALCEVVRFILYMDIDENSDEKKNAKDTVLDSFFIGGFIYYVSQLCDGSLSDMAPINIHLYAIYTITKTFQGGMTNG